MFNFSHSEQELRDIIQALEAKIMGLQTHLQKLVAHANEQAAAMQAPQAEAPASVAPAVQPSAAPAAPSQPSDPTAPIAVS